MSWDQRIRARAKNFLGVRTKPDTAATGQDSVGADGKLHGGDEEDPNNKNNDVDANNNTGHPVQYRLESTQGTPKTSILRWLLMCCGCFGTARSGGGLSVGVNPNRKLAMYLHWMFRVNFVFLFGLMCIMFFGLVILFSGFITIAGTVDPQCVRIGGEVFNAAGTAFADAFALSWTTFSTVGYGSTYPALGFQNNNWANCFFINFVCSLESLLGVLYSGFCGAILFGKILRIQSQAQVIFSDPIVIRYGTGVTDNQEDQDDDPSAPPKLPCPVLEFRIVNRLFREVGGEIMDATLNVVANIDADDAEPSLLQNSDSRQGMSTHSTAPASAESQSEGGSLNESARYSSSDNLGRSRHRFFDPFVYMGGRDHHAVDEDPSMKLVNKHIFSKMLIEASDHPFFKRVWLARHVLDEHSPILKARVRRQIRKNGGNWPERLNNYSAIRDSLRFNQILVSLNGVSNVSASDVYAQKIYDFVDINIGYQFVNILYRDSDGSLGVDTDLINDVREQNGGGGEPLIFDE